MIKLKGPTMGISGRFKIDVLNPKGELVKDKCLPEQKNLVTEAGLRALISEKRDVRLVLGTGSTTPQREDVRLDNTLTVYNSSMTFKGASSKGDTFFEVSKEFVFNLGQVVGNITELGLAGWYTSLSSYTLITRALIKDASGDATSIEVLEDEQIKITYTLRLEIDGTNEPYSIMVEKDGDLTEHTITPKFKLQDWNELHRLFGGMSRVHNGMIRVGIDKGYSNIGSEEPDSATNNNYAGSFSEDRKTYTVNVEAFAGINKWVGDISYVGVSDCLTDNSSGGFNISNPEKEIYQGTAFVWQVDPPITKTNEQVMEMTCSVSATYGD